MSGKNALGGYGFLFTFMRRLAGVGFAVVAVAGVLALAACDQKGLKTGQLKDCAAIQPNQREDAARAIKGLTQDAAELALVNKFGISLTEAKACLK